MLTAALGVAAFAAGATGTWSPCGFSMVDTIGHCAGGLRVRTAACATFALGALAGGALTFGSLAGLGDALHGGGGWLATGTAGAIAATAALGEARGVRIVPQIRRQVPEPWRRSLPLPVAVCGYGVLLGLGFTTFVLTLGVWALAGISFALGDFRLGLVVGLSFGLGRALPVVVLAPAADRPFGIRAIELMAGSAGLRLTRLANSVVLAASAAALLATGASAATVVARGATDPTVGGPLVGWDAGNRSVVRLPSGGRVVIGATDVALGGRYVAWIQGSTIRVVDLRTLQPAFTFDVPRVGEIALSDQWLVFRAAQPGGGQVIGAYSLTTSSGARAVTTVPAGAYVGRPAIDGSTVVYALATARYNAIMAVDLPGRPHPVRLSDRVQLSNPSLRDGRLLYVRTTSLDQRLVLGRLHGRSSRTLFSLGPPATRDNGYDPRYEHHTRTPPARPPARYLLWSTALAPKAAYVTLIARNGRRSAAHIVRIAR